ncbi:hypothetical protein N5P37_008807 [Trichoderma harzianum]|nr:hypothetical protein N5P37_008807 [Trichoderma harzianum]
MSKSRGLFWIKGNPGARKSVLMKYAVKMMNCRQPGELVVSFLIHGRGTPLQKNLLGVFRALLNSMLTSFPEYLSQLAERFNDYERRFGTYQENRWAWTEEELQEFMSEVLTKGTRSRPVTIFIDAIDEHFPLLDLKTISTISVEERIDKDIRLVIRERLEQIQPKARRQQMEKEILLKAQGGFQWVVLITSMVIDRNTIGIKAEKLHEMIKTTPEALDELYTNILSGVTEAEIHQMTKLFQWILFAERPLSAQELREALATDKDMTCTTISELRSHDSWSDTLDDFEKHVRHISRGLVEFHTREIWEQYEPGGEDSDREVQFVHQSVADYIFGKFLGHVGFGDASQSQIGAGHFEISRSCLRYLTLKEVSEGAQLPRGTFSARFPLVPYVVRSVFHHIREVERKGIPQHDLLQVIQWDRQSKFLRKIASIWRVMDPNNAHSPIGWPFIGATPLHVLIALESKSAFDALLQKDDVDVDGRDADGNTPLLLALRDGHQNMALALLNRSNKRQPRFRAILQSIIQNKYTSHRSNHFVDINAENNDGETPLVIALTLVGAEEVILKLIEAGADLFGQQTEPVFYAIRHRNKTLLLKLLQRNVKLDGAIYFALKELSYKGCDNVLEEFLSELLKAGANTHKSQKFDESFEDKDEHDDEALLLASRSGQTAIVNLLLSHGASATSRNNHGRFPLLVAAENGHEPIVKLLLDNGGESGDEAERAEALLSASQKGQTAIVNLLLSRGASATAQDKHGRFPLLVAAENGHEPIVKLLLENGVDVNAKETSNYGRTSLWKAVKNGHEAVAKLLIDKGADINVRDCTGMTLLSWAISEDNVTVVKFLITNKAGIKGTKIDGVNLLLWALQNKREAVARLLINNGIDINTLFDRGLTPLSWASQNGHEVLARLLIDNGANVNRNDLFGLTPLSCASQSGCVAIVRLLIDKGADVNASDIYGLNPLLYASQNGCVAIVRLLIDNKADINTSDQYRRTPLSLASRSGHGAVVRLLINNGADINTSDIFGSTPLTWALKLGHARVASILIDEGADGDQYGFIPTLLV